MKIRLSSSEATFTVSGTISRPQLLDTTREGTHQMRAEEFEAELCPPARADGAQRWEVCTLTVRGRRVDDRRRTLDVWTSRRFYHPVEFTDGVPDWVQAVAGQLLSDQPPPRPARRVFSLPGPAKPAP
ncbi:hypothetical protein AB0F03_36960 [Streptomyces sp. NPDC028722]|uniref:hypothetical protein n=1 Tax=Streptomyces sp. NPDC028722 TaxID=3155016 RepID=UPI00340CC842